MTAHNAGQDRTPKVYRSGWLRAIRSVVLGLLVPLLPVLGSAARAEVRPTKATPEEAQARLDEVDAAGDRLCQSINEQLEYVTRVVEAYDLGDEWKESELKAAKDIADVSRSQFRQLFTALLDRRRIDLQRASEGRLLKVPFVVHPAMEVQLQDGRTWPIAEQKVDLFYPEAKKALVAVHPLKAGPPTLGGHIYPALQQVARGGASHAIVAIDAKDFRKQLGTTELFRWTLYAKMIRDMGLESVISTSAGMLGTEWIGEQFFVERMLGYNPGLAAIMRYVAGIDHLGYRGLTSDGRRIDPSRLDTLGFFGVRNGGGPLAAAAGTDPRLWSQLPTLKKYERDVLAKKVPGYGPMHDAELHRIEVAAIERTGYAESTELMARRLRPEGMDEIGWSIVPGFPVDTQSTYLREVYADFASRMEAAGGKQHEHRMPTRKQLPRHLLTMPYAAHHRVDAQLQRQAREGKYGPTGIPGWATEMAATREKVPLRPAGRSHAKARGRREP